MNALEEAVAHHFDEFKVTLLEAVIGFPFESYLEQCDEDPDMLAAIKLLEDTKVKFISVTKKRHK